MKSKKRVVRVEWTDVFSEDVPVVSANALEKLAIQRLVGFMQRGNPSRATRCAAQNIQRPAKVCAQI